MTIGFSSNSTVDSVAGSIGCLVVALVATTVVLTFGAAVVALERQVEWPRLSSRWLAAVFRRLGQFAFAVVVAAAACSDWAAVVALAVPEVGGRSSIVIVVGVVVVVVDGH